mgnify:CR=1 FL=1
MPDETFVQLDPAVESAQALLEKIKQGVVAVRIHGAPPQYVRVGFASSTAVASPAGQSIEEIDNA